MEQVTLERLGEIARASRANVWKVAEECGREPKIYLHWTAGTYDRLYDEYHVLIDGEGNIFVSTEDFSQVLFHTWYRNSGGIGIALCCADDATTDNLGDFPPTHEQIEMMAKAIATICDALWLSIDKYHVMTHGEAADNDDGYTGAYGMVDAYGPKHGCEKWDLEFLGTEESPIYNPWADDGTRGGDVLRGKAIWYRQSYRARAIESLSR